MKCFSRSSVLLILGLLLSSCGGILSPVGQIAKEQKDLIIISFLLMLIVVIPVLILSVVIPLKYRIKKDKNGNAIEKKDDKSYQPEWAHSTSLELVWWGIPILLVFVLSVLAWKTSYSLDPYKKLDHEKEPIRIQVMSMDWKWLFIYQDYGIATVNLMQVPLDTPINLELASDGPMNSFWIPRVAGQIYTMTGMKTKLHVIVNEKGEYVGKSANYSGEGFFAMTFKVVATSEEDFNTWVKNAKATKNILDQKAYDKLIAPSENHPIEYFLVRDQGIFDRAISKYNPSHGGGDAHSGEIAKNDSMVNLSEGRTDGADKNHQDHKSH